MHCAIHRLPRARWKLRGVANAVRSVVAGVLDGSARAMITLTAPNGVKLEIDPEKISILEPAPVGLYAPGSKTVLRIDGEMHAVRETVAEIHAMRFKSAMGRV